MPRVGSAFDARETLPLALAGNPQIAAAEEKVRQAKSAATAAKSAYIPDVFAYARQSYQNGVPLRAEGERVAENRWSQGVVPVSARRQASAANYKAQAHSELGQTIGRTPGQ